MSSDINTASFEDIVNGADRRLRIVLDSLPIAVSWARLSDAKILFMNRKFRELFGYDVHDFSSVPDWVNKTYPDKTQQARAEESWYRYFGNPTQQEFEIDPVEVNVLCKDNTIKTTLHGGVILPEAGWALATFVDISERKRDEMLIKYLAEQDPLTGLPNRRSFDFYLSRAVTTAINEKKPMHLLLVDADYLKNINDTYGHQAGDSTIKTIAKRLKKNIRSGDYIARFGGDEFGIILENSGDKSSIAKICNKLLDAVAEPMNINGDNVSITICMGIGCVPEDASNPRDLFSIADKLLYQAKRDQRGSWRASNVWNQIPPGQIDPNQIDPK